MSVEYAIVVKNKTRLESLIERFNTKAQARFYIESMGGSFEDYESEHEVFHNSLLHIQTQLSQVIKHKIVERKYVPSFLFSNNQFIVVVGQDGLVANTAKYSRGVPIVAINPDTDRYDGVLLPFNPQNFRDAVEAVMSGQFRSRMVPFAEAKLNDGQRILAFNDLFIGASSHISARYKITFKDSTEEHSSSGIIVSTAAGSTGWLSSIFNMAHGVSSLFINDLPPSSIELDNSELLFAVREPFKSRRTQIDVCTGIIDQASELIIESLMPAGGVIFSDGIESDFLKFNSGYIARIGIAPEAACLVEN